MSTKATVALTLVMLACGCADAEGTHAQKASSSSSTEDVHAGASADGFADGQDPSLPTMCNEPISFVAVGNTGGFEAAAHVLGKAITDHCAKKGCTFVVFLGNIIHPGGTKDPLDLQWKKQLFEPYESRIPQHITGLMGPADYGHSTDPAEMKLYSAAYRAYGTYESTQFSMPMKNRTYGVTHNYYVAYAMVDSPLLMYGNAQEQVQDILGDYSGANFLWRITFAYHSPVHTNKTVPESPELRAAYDKIACKSFTDVMITASRAQRAWYSRPADCPWAEVIEVGSGLGTQEDPYDRTHFTGVQPLFKDVTSPGFLWMRITCTEIHGEFINLDGSVAFSRTIAYQ